jgi:hypothetical protein
MILFFLITINIIMINNIMKEWEEIIQHYDSFKFINK